MMMQAIRHVRKVNCHWISSQYRQGARNGTRKVKQTLFGTQARGGVISSIQSTISEARKGNEEKKEAKAFAAQMKYLTDSERMIDGNVYLETIEDLKQATGLSGFREHLPWVQNNPSLADMKREEAILHALSEADRCEPRKVKISIKKRVSRGLDVHLAEVEALLERICAMRDVQKWMLRRKGADKYLPANSAELQSMMMAPRSGFKRTRTYRNKFPNPGVKVKKNGKEW